MYEYLVVSHNNPGALGKMINEKAAEGWRLVCSLGEKSVILERQKSA